MRINRKDIVLQKVTELGILGLNENDSGLKFYPDVNLVW